MKKTLKKTSFKTKTTKVEDKINAILDKIRPYIQMHQGDVHLLGFKDGVVTLEISGACTHCHLADMTYNNLIGGLLKQDIPEVTEIVLEK
jgi:Fe-S cluster biogenesis protein NfuA